MLEYYNRQIAALEDKYAASDSGRMRTMYKASIQHYIEMRDQLERR